jgi:hypothetical protein
MASAWIGKTMSTAYNQSYFNLRMIDVEISKTPDLGMLLKCCLHWRLVSKTDLHRSKKVVTNKPVCNESRQLHVNLLTKTKS